MKTKILIGALVGFTVGFVLYPVPDFLTQGLYGGVPGAILGSIGCWAWGRHRQKVIQKTSRTIGWFPNKPTAPNAGIGLQLTFKHEWPGVGKPGRWATMKAIELGVI